MHHDAPFHKWIVSLLIFGALLFGFGPRLSADTFVLVEEGADVAPVVVFEDAPRFTRLAAGDLADYIEKVSGARPEVIEGKPSEMPARAIWVGYQPVLDSLFPEIDFEFEHPEEVLIAANEDHLVIAGRDVWDPENMVSITTRGDELHGVQEEYGTANAVYTFIQDHLDVRWLWPGELGEDIVKQEAIRFEPFVQRYHPQFRARRGLFNGRRMQRLNFRGDNDEQQLWLRQQRLLFDSLDAPGGHAYNDWWERFHEDHPEYFALQPTGGRDAHPNPHNVKICHSNPKVWEQWLDDVAAQIERHPERRVFNASPNDSYASGHCICADCRAWDHPDAEQYTFSWAGLGQRYVSLSDRHVTFANKVARLLKERYPDKDYYVGMLAYGNWRSAPIKAVPDDNVVIMGTFNFHNINYLGRDRWAEKHRQYLREWAETAPNMIWRPNIGSGEPRTGYARNAPHRAMADLRLAAESNAVGLFFDKIWSHWGMKGPHYYMLAQMAWDPYADGEAILQDYYERAFGVGSDAMAAYWTLMEQANERILEGQGKDDGEQWFTVYDESFCDEARSHIERAFEAVEGEPEKYRKRIEFVELGLNHTEALAKIWRLMGRVNAGEVEDEAAVKEEVSGLWLERIRPIVHSEEYPHVIWSGNINFGHTVPEKYYPEHVAEQW